MLPDTQYLYDSATLRLHRLDSIADWIGSNGQSTGRKPGDTPADGESLPAGLRRAALTSP
jgi:hypothetical protein